MKNADKDAAGRDRKRWERQTLGPAVPHDDAGLPRRTFAGGREVPPMVGPDAVGDADHVDRVGFPGQAPFVRGVQPTMYRGRLWTMRQYAGFGTAEETNRRYHYLLKHGTTGLSVAFDLPTQIGYDADDPMAEGEVGRTGVSISSLADMQALFDRIPLADITTSMTINAPAAVLWAMYLAVARGQGAPLARLGGTIQNDILKEYVARGTYIYPPRQSMRLVADTFAYAAADVPRWNPISISGYHIREAGSTAGQELAFTFGNAIAYVQAGLDAGLDVDAFGPRLSFFFNAHNDLLEEVGKFRAARRLWHRIMRDRFGAKDPRSWALRFHTQTGGSTLTASSPLNNVVRVALQALAATLGGTQSLHTNGFDEASALPTEKAARIALRTQQILAHETGVANTVDPFAGSWYVERVTDDLEAEAEAYLARIDRMGGMLRAIESGWVQREIQEAAYVHQRDVEAGRRVVVGVNAHVDDEAEAPEIHALDPRRVEAQVRKLRRFRQARDAGRHRRALRALEGGAEGDANLMPLLVDAVSARATTGEICHTLRHVWGEYRAPALV